MNLAFLVLRVPDTGFSSWKSGFQLELYGFFPARRVAGVTREPPALAPEIIFKCYFRVGLQDHLLWHRGATIFILTSIISVLTKS
jgi:hypothetical protein